MGSGEQSKYCWSKDNRAKAASKWRENQARGSKSWNFKNPDPEGIELMSQGPAEAMSSKEVGGSPCLESGWLLSGKYPDPTLASLPVPYRSAPSQAGGRDAPLAAPSA